MPTLPAAPPADLALARGRSSILTDTLGVSALTALAKVAGAGKSVAIAGVFGAGPALDAYLLAYLVPSFLIDVFCGSLVPALVPAFVGSRNGPDHVRLQAHVQCRCLLYACAIAALLLVAGSLTAGGFAATHLQLPGRLMAVMTPLFPLSAIANVWRAILNARGSFLLPAAGAVAVPLILIGATLAAGSSYGIHALAWATTLAVIAEVGVLGFAMRRAGCSLFPRSQPRTSIRKLWREYGYLSAAAAVSTGGYFLGQSIAAGLQPGSLSALNYGTRMTAVVLSIGPAALGVTVLPRFAELAALRHGQTFRLSLRRLLIRAGIAGGTAAILLMVLSKTLIRLVLEHGAFTAADTEQVALIQQISLTQLPFVICSTLLMRALAALESNRGLLLVSSVALVVNAALLCLLQGPYGVAGIAFATSVSQALLCGALLWLVFRGGGSRFCSEGTR